MYSATNAFHYILFVLKTSITFFLEGAVRPHCPVVVDSKLACVSDKGNLFRINLYKFETLISCALTSHY